MTRFGLPRLAAPQGHAGPCYVDALSDDPACGGTPELFANALGHSKVQPGNNSEDFLIRLTQLLLEIARDPQGALDLVMAGVTKHA